MTTFAVAAGHFGTDVPFNLERLSGLLTDARRREVELLVLPHGVLSGYHDHLDEAPATDEDLPAAHRLDGPELDKLVSMAGDLVVCAGITEAVGDGRANTAVVFDGDGVLGVHRKVHLPRGEEPHYVAGDRFEPVDTPVGRVGLLVDYDKTFPEAARTLACAGADFLAVPCAWPASRTNRADTLVKDRQRRLYDLYDQARAAENQLYLLSANQTGRHGALRFLGQSKIVAPDGSVVSTTGARAGLATHDGDVARVTAAARRVFHHLRERRPASYSDR